jgi:hypothetical protein
LTTDLFCQQIAGSFGVGLGTYSMNSLKNYNKSLVAEDFNGINPVLTENFPAYIFYQAAITLTEKKTIYGLSIAHGSTGSRVMYGDYSGKLIIDNLIRYNAVGIHLGEIFFSRKNFNISANARASGIFNKLKVKEKLDIYGSAIESSTGYHSVNFGLQPFFRSQYNIGKLLVSLDIGYEYQITGRIFVNNEANVYVTDSTGNKIFIDGRGFRGLVNFGYRFNKE